MKGIVLLLVAIGVVFFFRSQAHVSPKEWEQRFDADPQKALLDFVAEAQKDSRKYGSDDLSLKSVSAGPGQTLTFDFMMTRYSSTQINSQVAGMLSSGLTKAMCADKDVRMIYSHGITVRIGIRGTDGAVVTMPRVSKNICENG